MKLNKRSKLLLVVVGVGVFLHTAAILILVDMPLSAANSSYKQTSLLTKCLQREDHKKKSAQLSYIFQNLKESTQLETHQTKECYEAKAEFAPPHSLQATLMDPSFFEKEEIFSPLSLTPKTQTANAFLPEKPEERLYFAFQTERYQHPTGLIKALFAKEGILPTRGDEALTERGVPIGNPDAYSITEFMPHDLTNVSGYFDSDLIDSTTQAPFFAQSDLPKQQNTETSQAAAAEATPQSPPPAPSLSTHAQEGVLASSDHFDVQVECNPKRSRPGYVFKITLTPKKEISFKRIRHNFAFLIDRSNSIARARYRYNRKAVFDALSHLKSGDTFNILVFDERVNRLSQTPLLFTQDNVAKARHFLEKNPHGGLFASTDLYSSLGKIVPKAVKDKEMYTAFLLSDGDTYLSTEKQRLTIGKWSQANAGKVSLYCLASGAGNNLPLLELISGFNKGKLVYAKEHTKMPRALSLLMKSIQNPIGKSLVVTAVPGNAKQTVLLQPRSCRLPNLYENTPYEIYGSTNQLKEFTLFLQGRYYDQHFDIAKTIDLKSACHGMHSIEAKWMRLLSDEIYEKYFEDGNPIHLQHAKEILEPLNLPIALGKEREMR